MLDYLISQIPSIGFSVSATTRAPRGNEKNGEDYYFISMETFKARVANDEFLEWQEVYEGTCYGTLKAEVRRLQNKGVHVAFDVDVVGGTNIKKFYGDEALSIFIKAPSLETLRERLIKRGTDSMESIEKRLAKAEWEMEFAKDKFDVTIINDDLETAKKQILEVVTAFIKK